MNNKTGNFFYNVGHHLYMSGGSNGDISMKEATIIKMEIIKETPKKFKIRFTKLSTFNKVPTKSIAKNNKGEKRFNLIIKK